MASRQEVVAAPARPRPAFNQPKGTTVRVSPQSDRLYFVYAGADRGVMINPAVFLTETGLFDQNLVLMQDRWNAYYQCGISPELPSFEAILAWQRDLRDALPHVARVFCVGACMGGYAAIAFGHLLAVEEVWAFGAVTRLPDGVDRRCASADADLRSVRRGAADTEIPPERADLGLALRRGNGVTRYNLFFHAQHHEHAAAAARVAGCEHVTLRPQPGDAYNVVQTLLDLALLPVVMVPHRSASGQAE